MYRTGCDILWLGVADYTVNSDVWVIQAKAPQGQSHWMFLPSMQWTLGCAWRGLRLSCTQYACVVGSLPDCAAAGVLSLASPTAIVICRSSAAHHCSRYLPTFLHWLRPLARPSSHIHALEQHPTHEQWKSAMPLILLAMPPLLSPLVFQAVFLFMSFHLWACEYWFQSFPFISLRNSWPVRFTFVLQGLFTTCTFRDIPPCSPLWITYASHMISSDYIGHGAWHGTLHRCFCSPGPGSWSDSSGDFIETGSTCITHEGEEDIPTSDLDYLPFTTELLGNTGNTWHEDGQYWQYWQYTNINDAQWYTTIQRVLWRYQQDWAWSPNMHLVKPTLWTLKRVQLCFPTAIRQRPPTAANSCTKGARMWSTTTADDVKLLPCNARCQFDIRTG